MGWFRIGGGEHLHSSLTRCPLALQVMEHLLDLVRGDPAAGARGAAAPVERPQRDRTASNRRAVERDAEEATVTAAITRGKRSARELPSEVPPPMAQRPRGPRAPPAPARQQVLEQQGGTQQQQLTTLVPAPGVLQLQPRLSAGGPERSHSDNNGPRLIPINVPAPSNSGGAGNPLAALQGPLPNGTQLFLIPDPRITANGLVPVQSLGGQTISSSLLLSLRPQSNVTSDIRLINQQLQQELGFGGFL